MRVLKIILNWMLFLTLPIWGGPVLFALFIMDAILGKNDTPRKILAGKQWAWTTLQF